MSSIIPQRRLESFPAFAAYRAELTHWLDGTAVDEVALYRAGVALCSELRVAAALPEHILMELHSLGLKTGRREASREEGATQDRRYLLAIRLLLQSCFGEEPPLRSVRGADGREWIVLLVREGMRWDPEIEMRRRDWLSCVAPDDRRYITPVPAGWLQWTDGELVMQILRAPADLRGPK
jgi:hypothetical protein